MVVLCGLILSCNEDEITTSPSAQLRFSVDTLTFDTVFTSIGSATKRFTVINPNSRKVVVSKIALGNAASPYRLNINGIESKEAFDIEIPSKDSIYIFVEVTVDPTGVNNPLLIQDSIIFETNWNIQDVNLVAFGQDFHLFDGEVIGTQHWKNDKPYLIYNSILVDSIEKLTIDAGCRLYFHKGSSLLVKGTLEVNGTFEEPVSFQGDRLEKIYRDVPEQWGARIELDDGSLYMLGGIHFLVGSTDNRINYATIRNATKGIQADSLGNSPNPVLTITNSRIENMSLNCLDARSTSVVASNCIFANSGSYSVALRFGGKYRFTHCTIANYSGGKRDEPALILNNYYKYSGGVRSIDLSEAFFGNCIIYGNNTCELILDNSINDVPVAGQFNYFFNHCLIKTGKNLVKIEPTRITGAIAEKEPVFINPAKFDFSLDSLSTAKNTGNIEIATRFPFDLNNKPRLIDEGPDLGALEWIPTKDR